jgi:pimeloyl-ACP methyl ester carboxylesterase
VDALGLTKIDLFGFSTGGFVAQEVILLRPRLVRRLILGGTGPQGGRGFHNWSEETGDHAYKDVQGVEDGLYLLFCDRDEPGQGQGVSRTDLHPRTGPRRDADTGVTSHGCLG